MGRSRPEVVEIIPGTEIIYRDDGGKGASQVVLVPQPSLNRDDPLNWSKTWKSIIIVNQFVFVFVSIMTTLAIPPLSQIFMHEFDKSLTEVNMLFGATAITLGYANLVIVPLANVYGRRPVMLVSGVASLLASVWQGLVTSYPSFIGARVIAGLGTAANESLMPMVVADMLFTHQRGSSMGLFFWAYFIGIFIGPVVSGSAASHIGWRWFFYICAILQAASIVFLLIAHPETKYDRQAADSLTASRSVDGDAEARPGRPSDVSSHKEAKIIRETRRTGRKASGEGASVVTGTAPVTMTRELATTKSSLPRGHPSRSQFSLIPRARFFRGWAPVLHDVVAPLHILFSCPIVLWVSLTMGFSCNTLLALNLTEAQIFAAPPYLFGPDQLGNTNWAFAVGAVVGLFTAGPLSDWWALRRARHNGGVLEAEMRLPALLPYMAICIIGMAVAGVGAQRAWGWESIVVVGYGFIGCQVVGIPAIVIAYAVDSYKALPGEIMTAATIVKNTFGFGMIFFFNNWAHDAGYIPPFLTMMALTIGFATLGLIIFIPFGKTFRYWTKDSHLHALR